ncbi:MAG: hypothetical protein LBQ12_12970 [Deltaproteobacteria bacterium]|nr:hypothetical protein [Deltaproteobacteria bacterium]
MACLTSSAFAALSLAVLAAAGLTTAGPATAADPPPEGSSVGHVGDFDVNLIPPEGMAPVFGLCAAGDRFLYQMNERFKLVVLAAYADPDLYRDFCEAMVKGEYRQVPNIALVSVPRRMSERSYDGPRTAKEIKRYVSWFSLGTNTRLIAVGLENRANAALTKKLGTDLDFTYRLGDASRVFHRTPSSLGIGVLASFKLGGGRSDNYVAAAVYQMADKLIFLSMVGQDQSGQGVEATRGQLLGWGRVMSAANAPPMAVKEAAAQAAPEAAPGEPGKPPV